MKAELLLRNHGHSELRLKRKGYDDMHTFTDTPQIKKLDPEDADEVEM